MSEYHDDQDEFAQKMRNLMSDNMDGDDGKFKLLTDATRARQEKLKKTVTSLQESLDYLRVSVKYLVFDLEATRRENQYLRKLLEAGHGPGDLDAP